MWGNPDLERFQQHPYEKYQALQLPMRNPLALVCIGLLSPLVAGCSGGGPDYPHATINGTVTVGSEPVKKGYSRITRATREWVAVTALTSSTVNTK